MAKTKSKKTYTLVYTRSQKIKGWLALIMLFVCGLMTGLGIGHKTIESQQTISQAAQQSQQKEHALLSKKFSWVIWLMKVQVI